MHKSRSRVNVSTFGKRALLAASATITPVSYMRIKFFQYNSDASPRLSLGKNIERDLMVNLNCPIRLLMEYVRVKANIPVEIDFDLFDEMGNLKHTFDAPVQKMASKILFPKAIYFIVILPKNEIGIVLKPTILINRGSRLNADYVTRIRRQLQHSGRKTAK
ncbi:uncharacterized protein LOC123301203 [Chrysoperla carnea]|uniref:uncharacterized protein LOC123301203 n=1 Tax=Chrysoperla carnea TaxID=189513 RepID=UPI001D088CB9|nr:uncharacterized protein LOC123301203 [Chrysoperla carnea]